MSEYNETTEGVETPSPRREPRPLKLRHLIGVALVTALFMGPISAFASHQFPDVPNSNLFHEQVDWMSDTGITTGFPDGTFRPNANVTRGQMSAFMFRLYNLQAGLTSVDGGTNGGGVGGPGNIDTWETVNGLSTAVSVPPGTTGRINATFTGEVTCNSGDNTLVVIIVTRASCDFRFLINGNQMSPGVYTAVQSLDAAETADLGIDTETATLQAYTGNLNPGNYTVTVQMMANDNDGNGDPGDDSLTLDVGSHQLTTEVALNDRLLAL